MRRAGRQHAEQVAKTLAGVASSVKVVELPGLPPKGDVSDWLDAGGTVEALIDLFERTAPIERIDPTGSSLDGKESSADVELPPPEFSDDALALAFAHRHQNDRRYVGAWNSWLSYDGPLARR